MVQELPKAEVSTRQFEQLYLKVRQAEQRVYTDEHVRMLPDIGATHVHYGEWQIRKASAQRLISHLQKKRRPLHILEVGCGNGWLSSMLAGMPGAVVVGVDINTAELDQAQQVFANKMNLTFQSGDIREGIFKGARFDIIVFAASIQYFPSLSEVLKPALSLLKAGGQVHILDSHFYNGDQLAAAQKRTEAYYSSMGCSELSAFYFHHSWTELSKFNYELMYDPQSLANRLFGKKHPFCWVCVQK